MKRREPRCLAARRRGRSRRAQQSAIPLVGYFSGRSSDSEELLLSSFRKGLEEEGFTIGWKRRLPTSLAGEVHQGTGHVPGRSRVLGHQPHDDRSCPRRRRSAAGRRPLPPSLRPMGRGRAPAPAPGRAGGALRSARHSTGAPSRAAARRPPCQGLGPQMTRSSAGAPASRRPGRRTLRTPRRRGR